MTYCARYRVRIVTPPTLQPDEVFKLSVPGFPEVEVTSRGQDHRIGTWVIFTIRGFQTEEEAMAAGRRLGDALLVAGAAARFGIDLSDGLRVYRDGMSLLVEISARGFVSTQPKAFEERVATWADASGLLNHRQKISAELLNDSYFALQTESRFLLCVAAVESLCDQHEVEPTYVGALGDLEACLAGMDVDETVRGTVAVVLTNAKRKSIRQAYMGKFRALLSDAEARAFDELYEKRSDLLHDGKGRGELREASDEALDLATRLLQAELRQVSGGPPDPRPVPTDPPPTPEG